MQNKPSSLQELLDTGMLRRGSALERASSPQHSFEPGWMRGRVGILCGESTSALVTLAAHTILDLQHQRELCVWLTDSARLPHAPDLREMGLDLGAVPLIRLADAKDAAHAAMMALSSGAFGSLVWDVRTPNALPRGAMTAIGMLAKRHDVAVMLLCHEKDTSGIAGSIGVDWSANVSCSQGDVTDFLDHIEVTVTADKRHRFYDRRRFEQPCSKVLAELCARLVVRGT